MDDHQTWYVGEYCHLTGPYSLPFRSDAHASRTIDFGGYKRLKQRFPHHFWQSSWWIFTKLDMWVGITTILTPINWRSGRMHRLHAPLTLMAKNARNRGFQTFSDRVLYGSSQNFVCGLVLHPYCALTEVSRPFLTELLMDHHQTLFVGWYYRPTEPFLLPFQSDAHIMHEWVWVYIKFVLAVFHQVFFFI